MNPILKFFLKPFAGVIRVAALKTMKRTAQPQDRRPYIAIAGHVLQDLVLPAVFKTFQGAEFQKLAGFEKLTLAEKDRIFIELEVTGIIFGGEAVRLAKYRVKEKDFHFWARVEDEYPRQLQFVLTGFGVDSANAKLFRDLVKMRAAEYEKLSERLLRSGMLFEPEVKQKIEDDFSERAGGVKDLLALAQAAAFGTVDHIKRGELDTGDPLVKFMMKFSLALYHKVLKFAVKL